MDDYTFMEFMVKPSLMREYLSNKEEHVIRAIFLNYIDHIQSLCVDDPKQIASTIESSQKLSRLLKIVFIINESYTPKYTDFSRQTLQFELVRYYLKAAQLQPKLDVIHYYLLSCAFTLLYLKDYILHKELTDDKLNSMINIVELEQQIILNKNNAYSLLNVQLLIELNLLMEQYNIAHLFQLHDQLPQQNVEGYSCDKIEDYRQIVLSIKDELSPVTDVEEMSIEPVYERKVNKSQNQYFYQELISGVTGPRIMTAYLLNAIPSNNRDCLIQIQQLINGNKADEVVDLLITLFLSNKSKQQFNQLEMVIHQIDFTRIYDINIIALFGQVILQKSEYARLQMTKSKSVDHSCWKDTAKCLILLLNKYNKPIQDTLQSLSEFVDGLLSNQIIYPYKIDHYVVNIQMAINILISHMIAIYHQLIVDLQKGNKIDCAELKLTLSILDKIFNRMHTQSQWDIITQYISCCLSKSVLECLQCLFLKQANSNTTEYNTFYTLFPLLQQFHNTYEIKVPLEFKNHIVSLLYKREKIIMIQTFESMSLEEQLQFRYSKLYKKKLFFYNKQKNYHKSIRLIIKYYQAYIANPGFDDTSYLAETQVLECLFDNFKQINANAYSLIVTQLINIKIDNDVFINLDINAEVCQFFFDTRIIEKICSNNRQNQELLKLMIARIQDPDSYATKSAQLLLQIQEKYLHKFIGYLGIQMIK